MKHHSTEDLIGKLTGYRCPECGCCLWTNNINHIWCSGCHFRIFEDDSEHDIHSFHYVPVPDDHPYRMGGVTVV